MVKIKKREIVFFIFVCFIFLCVVGKYTYKSFWEEKIHTFLNRKTPIVWDYSCKEGEIKIAVPGGTVCRPANTDNYKWISIFDKYPLSGQGKEVLYDFFNEENVDAADKMLTNYWEIPRYDGVQLAGLPTWNEDPYNERYWRFDFYSLRETRYLLNQWIATGNQKYKNKLVDILNSYFDNEAKGKYVWDDYHAVSFRALILTDVWWKLREHNGLPLDLNDKLLASIKIHGDFLLNNDHYQAGNNHGVTEAMALVVLGENFPDLPNAAQWGIEGKQRLSDGLLNIVDDNGVLVENSPYYHFYVLEEYWNIYRYSQKFNIKISDDFLRKLKQMIFYATYILQPDGEVPLLGASLKQTIHLDKTYKEMGEIDKNLLYVLTRGEKGTRPPFLNITFPESRQTIIRSDWGNGEDFTDSTQLIFNIGNYRTLHSDLSALSFTLYGEGMSLMPDSGLYTYEENDFKNYFHGTLAHNTVVVDDKDQSEGMAMNGEFHEKDDVIFQSATSNLYKEVTHKRAITLIGKNLILIVDDLTSDNEHKYDQIFHLFPGATLKNDGLTANVYDQAGKQALSIKQLIPDSISFNSTIGQTNPPRGICSEEYQKYIPCYLIDYSTKAKNKRFVTLIELGESNKNLKTEILDNDIKIFTGDKNYDFNFTATPEKVSSVNVTDANQIDINKSILPISFTPWEIDSKKNNNSSISNFKVSGFEYNFLARTPSNGETLSLLSKTDIDLSDKNIFFNLRVYDMENIKNLELNLYSGDGKSHASINLKDSYRDEYSGEFKGITLSKGELSTLSGAWKVYGKDFNWSKITKINFEFSSQKGYSVPIEMSKFSLISGQKKEDVTIVFDDGYESILPAAQYMNSNGLKGNVAVIGYYTKNKAIGHLTIEELKSLNSQGWDILNHSYLHKNALTEYYSKGDLLSYEDDVLAGAKFLQENGLNSDPNWFIYPNGATNSDLKSVISKYYKFGRTTASQPEAFPFGDPLTIKAISINNTTKPEEIIKAIQDTQEYKTTLFLTFHRIEATEFDRPGYPIENFKVIIDYLVKNKINVVSVSEFDKEHGVSANQQIFSQDVPSHLDAEIVVTHNNMLKSIKDCLITLKNEKEHLDNYFIDFYHALSNFFVNLF
jgi:peptidoglycan/xylan/chitin deacetylase (PgdA/CDA1 family)